MREVDVARSGERLDGLEAGPELLRRGPQRRLRIDTEMAGDVDDREQQVAELVAHGVGV